MIEASLDSIHINFDTQTIWILNVALALVMFGIALEISISDFKRLLKKPKPVLVGVVSQFLILPLVTFLFVLVINPMPSIALGMFMVAACPGGNVSNFMTHLAKGNTALSVSLTAMATLLAILMTPFNLQFWGSLYEPTASLLEQIAISPLEMIKLVTLLLAVPLFLGMWVHYLRPVLAQKMARFFKLGSLLFFLALVVLALMANKDVFMEYVFYVFWIVIGHNVLAFLTGFSWGTLFKLEKSNVRSITIETGIQNSGLGLILIITFFDGLGGMAILAAFWGIWHLISGLLLAGYWSKRPIKKIL